MPDGEGEGVADGTPKGGRGWLLAALAPLLTALGGLVTALVQGSGTDPQTAAIVLLAALVLGVVVGACAVLWGEYQQLRADRNFYRAIVLEQTGIAREAIHLAQRREP